MNALSPDPGDPKSGRGAMAAALGAGIELVVAVVLGIYAGTWCDKKLGTKPWLSLAGFLIGTCVGIYQLVRSTRLPPGGRH